MGQAVGWGGRGDWEGPWGREPGPRAGVVNQPGPCHSVGSPSIPIGPMPMTSDPRGSQWALAGTTMGPPQTWLPSGIGTDPHKHSGASWDSVRIKIWEINPLEAI